MKNRKRALAEGFKAALLHNRVWTFFETVADAEEFARDNNIEKPKCFDVKTGKRVLV